MKSIISLAIILSALLFSCNYGKVRSQNYYNNDASAEDAGSEDAGN